MANLTDDRLIKRREGVEFGFPVATGKTVYAGGLVGLDATGAAVPASESVTPIVGVAQFRAVSGQLLRLRRGVFAFANAADVDALTPADYGTVCYVADDQTVKKTAGTPAAPIAGIVRDVNESGVWVEL